MENLNNVPQKRKTHYRVCNYCEAMCGVSVDYDPKAATPEAVFKVRPDKDDTFSKGSMCPKAAALGPLFMDPSRLKYPVKKVLDNRGEIEWQRISWDEAYQTVADNLIKIKEQNGPNSIASYLGNPIVHNLGMLLFVKVFTKAIGSKNIFSATSMDQLPHHFAGHFMFGHEFRIPVPDIDRTDHMIIMGANPMASNGSIMTSAGVSKRLQKIQKRGGKFIVIDPRKTETAKICSEHHFIKPATDLYFLLAFLHVLFRDGAIKLGHVQGRLNDFELIEPLVTEFSPKTVSPIIGIDESEIERLVTEFTAAKSAVLYGRMGLSTQPHGGLCHWLINTINIVSGNFDKAGGMMFPSPAIELARDKQKEIFGRWKSRVRNLREFAGELPVSTMADELLNDGTNQVKGFITICGNPVLSTPGGHRLDKALEDIDFMVSIDNYINETTRHADIILPTPSGLEIDHYDLIFNQISVSNNAKFSQAMMPVEPDRPFDWQVLKELGQRIAPKGLPLFDRIMTPRRIVNLGLMLGEYGRLSSPRRWFSGLSLKKVIASEHGVDLGPMRSRVPQGLNTRDKKIHLAPTVFLERLEEVRNGEFQDLKRAATPQNGHPPLTLIGRRNVYTNNSWMHQVPNLNKSKQVRCTAMIHPIDAQLRDLNQDETVMIRSRVGEILIPVEITETVMPGVVSIPHGFGHNKKGTRVPVADQKPGVSVNDLTDPMRIDPLTGNAAFSGLELEIIKIEEHRETSVQSGKPLTILYGSQSGNSEMIALDVAKAAAEHELLPRIVNMADIDVEQLFDVERLLLIVSTFGEGDMPDAAEDLWNAVQALSNNELSKVNYSVLALGDSTYENFCQSGLDWNTRLAQLGANRIKEVTKCDVDYLDTAQQWLDENLPEISLLGDQSIVEQDAKNTPSSVRYNRGNPMPFNLSAKRLLNGPGSTKETMHYDLSFSQDGVNYQAGDALYLIPKNNKGLVNRWLSYLQVEAESTLPGFNEDARTVLTQLLDIRLPSPATIELIARHSKELSTLINNDLSNIEQPFYGLELLDIIDQYNFPLEHKAELLNSLPPLGARAYSISSSPTVQADMVSITVASVRYGEQSTKQGVASCFLVDDLEVGNSVDGYFVSNKHFSIPQEQSVPVIMIGPGTGIAPFRSFLYERSVLKHSGKNWLFFGDRNVKNDFLYQDELLQLQSEGVLTHLSLAFSRDQEQKVYVQDRIKEHAVELYQWIQEGAYIYVCGDAQHMAESVETALTNVISTQANINKSQAQQTLSQMTKDKRYVKDVY